MIEHEPRVDGRDLIELDEPGSDDLLLRGLLLHFAALHENGEDDRSIRERIRARIEDAGG